MAREKQRTLNDYDTWHRGLRNYDWLQSVVPGATDVDFLTERHGSFLVFETKHWNHGVRVPIGQDIMLRQMDGIRAHTAHCEHECPECGPGYRPFSVYLVGEQLVGEGEDEDRFHVMRFGRPVSLHQLYPPALFEPSTRDDLRQLVRRWEHEL